MSQYGPIFSVEQQIQNNMDGVNNPNTSYGNNAKGGGSYSGPPIPEVEAEPLPVTPAPPSIPDPVMEQVAVTPETQTTTGVSEFDDATAIVAEQEARTQYNQPLPVQSMPAPQSVAQPPPVPQSAPQPVTQSNPQFAQTSSNSLTMPEVHNYGPEGGISSLTESGKYFQPFQWYSGSRR